jgi:hypothetical protein
MQYHFVSSWCGVRDAWSDERDECKINTARRMRKPSIEGQGSSPRPNMST